MADDQDTIFRMMTQIPSDKAAGAKGFQVLRRQIDYKKAYPAIANLRKFMAHILDVPLVAQFLTMCLQERFFDETAKVFAQGSIEDWFHISS
jgi:hypothetical protein